MRAIGDTRPGEDVFRFVTRPDMGQFQPQLRQLN